MYSSEDKREAFELWVKTDNLNEVARILNIALSTLCTWKETYGWEAEKQKSLEIVKKSTENKLQAMNKVLVGELGKSTFEMLSSLGTEFVQSISQNALDATNVYMNRQLITEMVARKALQALNKFKPRNWKEAIEAINFVQKNQDQLLSFQTSKKPISKEEDVLDADFSIKDLMKKDKPKNIDE